MGVCHFDQKSSTQKSGNLPKIETQKSGNSKCQAFLLHEKTYHPNQKVLDINSTFQFYLFQRILLFYDVCAESFKFSSTTISLKPGFHMIVTIVAIAENDCDDPDYHMETPIFFSVTTVTIRIATVVEIETSSISTIAAIK